MGGTASIISCEGEHDPATGGTLYSGGSYAYFPRENCQGMQGTRGFGGDACRVLGGGGGAGYYGGGGGASGGGGGGSSYADQTITRNVSYSIARTRGNGYLQITYRDPRYIPLLSNSSQPTHKPTKPNKRSPSKRTRTISPKPTRKQYMYRTHSPSRKPTKTRS